MTLCPIALMTGCRKCPAFSYCPVKGIIGDYKKHEKTQATQKIKTSGKDQKR